MKKKYRFKIIKEEEQDEFADSRFLSDGESFLQPYIEFVFDGVKGYLSDKSSWEFGTKWVVKWNGFKCNVNTMNKVKKKTNFDKNNLAHWELSKQLDYDLF